MADVKVYLFDYFDRVLKRDRRSTFYATADAIASERGTILAESERIVDDALLNDDGTIAAHKIPPREEVPPPRAPRPGSDAGVGRG